MINQVAVYPVKSNEFHKTSRVNDSSYRKQRDLAETGAYVFTLLTISQRILESFQFKSLAFFKKWRRL
jgi:hypothetical protein